MPEVMNMDLLTAKLKQWNDRKIAVLGLGVSNRPLVRLLLEAGCHVTGFDIFQSYHNL